MPSLYGTPGNIRTNLILPEPIEPLGCIFIADSMGLSSFKFSYALLKRSPRLYPFILVILVSSVFFGPTFEPLAVISNVQRAKVPRSESSRERKFHGTFVPGSESSREQKFQGTKVPPYGTFVPRSESS